MKPWRDELFHGLPTELERRTDATIDNAVAARILVIEGLTVSEDEIAKYMKDVEGASKEDAFNVIFNHKVFISVGEVEKFVQVVRPKDVRARGMFVITWKGIPIVDIIRQGNYPKVKIAVLERNVGPEPGEIVAP